LPSRRHCTNAGDSGIERTRAKFIYCIAHAPGVYLRIRRTTSFTNRWLYGSRKVTGVFADDARMIAFVTVNTLCCASIRSLGRVSEQRQINRYARVPKELALPKPNFAPPLQFRPASPVHGDSPNRARHVRWSSTTVKYQRNRRGIVSSLTAVSAHPEGCIKDHHDQVESSPRAKWAAADVRGGESWRAAASLI